MPLDWQTIQLPLVAGLDTKTHAFAIEPPGLLRAQNVEFDENGGLRYRKPYASIGTNILGGGTLSGVRKIVAFGDELLAFTATGLYTWSSTLSAWVSRGTHLAVKVEETTRFSNPTDQVFADRAQLGGLIVYVWVEVTSTTLCYLAAIDATTEATVIAPTSFGASNIRPRVVALDTKILVTWSSGAALLAKAIDPAAPSFTTSGATTLAAAPSVSYDIVRDPLADRAVYVTRTGSTYLVGRVTAAMATTTASKARTADGIVALAVDPTGTAIMVIRTDGIVVKGDALALASLSDGANVNVTVIGTSVGDSIDHIACAFRTVQNGGAYRCYVFASGDETDESDGLLGGASGSGTSPHTYSNWIDSSATFTGTEAAFVLDTSVASRAFDYGGTVYVWLSFGRRSNALLSTGGSGTVTAEGLDAAYQNGYFLYDDAGSLHSKAVTRQAGGNGYLRGTLPGVALVSGSTGFAWCGLERDFIDTTGSGVSKIRSYADRAPRDVVVTFDSNEARRCARLGDTLYITGGQILQYDGEALAEVGFEVFPWYLALTDSGSGGTIDDAAHTYKLSWRWPNARGESERSTVAVAAQFTANTPGDKVTVGYKTLAVTRKRGARRAVAVEGWRTASNPAADSPYYLDTSRDPSATGDNKYVENAPAVGDGNYTDNYTDAILATKELHPENGGALQHLAPPGASIICASESRLFLAGIPGDPFRVVYSCQRGDAEIAAFNPALSFTIPPDTGAITGLATWQGSIVVFTASAVYRVGGEGFDNLGSGSNYGPATLIASDTGALSHDTIAVTPGGILFFSRKGWYLLNGGLSLEYVGAPVEDFNSDTWVAAQVVESQHQVRVLSTSRMLVWDYLLNRWAEWTQSGGLGLAIWRSTPMLLDTAVKAQLTSLTGSGADYDYLVELLIKPAGMQGLARVRKLMILGQYKFDHAQRVRITYDYSSSGAVDDKTMTFAGLHLDGPTQFKHGPSRQRMEAMKVTISIAATGEDNVVLTGIALEVGLRRGLYPRLSAAQKQ